MQYKCNVCGYIYDEGGLDPTTGEKNVVWNDLPEDWVCPKCNTPKSNFNKVAEDEDSEEDFEETTEEKKEEEDKDIDDFSNI